MQRFNVCNYLNFFINETINVQKERIINLYCYVSSDDNFYIKTTVGLVEKTNIATQAK